MTLKKVPFTEEQREKLQKHVNQIKEFLALKNIDVPFYIAGGSVYSILNGFTKYHDIDVYFTNEADKVLIREIYKTLGNFTTDNAITFKNTDDLLEPIRKIHHGWLNTINLQFVLKSAGNIEEIFSEFDLNCSCCAFSSYGELLVSSSYSTNIELNNPDFGPDILARYRKYTDIKKATDSCEKTKYNIYDILLNNLNKQFNVYYNNQEVYYYSVINMEITINKDKDLTQYCHDVMTERYYGDELRVLFSKMDYFLSEPVSIPCNELLLERLLKIEYQNGISEDISNELEIDVNVLLPSISEIHRIKLLYPEEFI